MSAATGQIFEATGLFQETLRHLKRALNFSTVDIVSTDGSWGALVNDRNGTKVNPKYTSTYNGMVGMLERKEVDLSSAR